MTTRLIEINLPSETADLPPMMLHKAVLRELYAKERRAGRRSRMSRNHAAVILLMMIILGCWALDSMHVNLVPHSMHQSVAWAIDEEANRWPTSTVVPSIDDTVAHNPIDDSPVTFGSVILLGVVCVGGLLILGFSASRKEYR
jgi:hypothetical protein